jgi:hypothetical protein
MALEKKILQYTKPTIKIDELSYMDPEDNRAPLKSKIERTDMQKGGLHPIIEVNRYAFSPGEILTLEIDETGNIPTCHVSVVMMDGKFISTAFPKDGDKMSIFIRSRKDELKPLRADFSIISVSGMPSTDETGERSIIYMGGILSIPGYIGEHCKAYKDMTSFDSLIKLATDLGLGFASNETLTNDKMTWICPYQTYEKFMMSVTQAAYKDDSSFYKSWIDHNYYMNLLNVNTQFSDEVDIDKAFEEMSRDNDYFNKQEIQKFETSLLLTNAGAASGTGNFIKSYTLINNSGNVVLDNGYRRYLQYYEAHLQSNAPSDKYKSFFIEPMHTDGAKDKIILRGRAHDPTSGTEYKYKWLGLQTSLPTGNVHENYLHAMVSNWQNNEEIDKLMLYCQLGKCNFNIYRGQRIPVIIMNIGNAERQKITQDDSQPAESKVSYDRFLSGYYMVHGFKYSWSSATNNFQQDLYLTRREWPMPTFVPANTPPGSTQKDPNA